MTSPVDPVRNAFVDPPRIARTQPLPPQAPPGLGGTPTTLERGSQPQDYQFVDRVLIFIKDCLVWIFQRLFCCFYTSSNPAPSVQTSAPPARAPITPMNPRIGLRNRLHVLDGADLMRAFNEYFPSEAEKAQVYAEIGKTVPRSWYSKETDEQMGKRVIQTNPKLVIAYLLRRIHEAATQEGYQVDENGNPHEALRSQLHTLDRESLIRSLGVYFSSPEEKEYVYGEIGQAVQRPWYWKTSNQEIGKKMVEKNHKLLIPYLLSRINANAN